VLIVAAPEMLAMLEELVPVLYAEGLATQVERLIAKAKGE
jgi:hypothetical protein